MIHVNTSSTAVWIPGPTIMMLMSTWMTARVNTRVAPMMAPTTTIPVRMWMMEVVSSPTLFLAVRMRLQPTTILTQQ